MWHNRIVKYSTAPADQFTPHPLNARRHPVKQQNAVRASIEALGWVAPVIVNARTGYLLDGHERLWQALQSGDDTLVPYIEVDLSEGEEALFLAAFDYITALAQYDRAAFSALRAHIAPQSGAIEALLDDIARHAVNVPDIPAVPTPQNAPETPPFTHECPNCGHRW